MAAAVVAVAAAAGGSAVALGSTGASAGAAGTGAARTSPGSMIIHPAVSRMHISSMAPVPLTDSQCEGLFQIQCYVPDQVEAAYNLPALYSRGITGKGRTIVIVDAFGSPTIADDLLAFDQVIGIGAPSLRIVKFGQVPAFDSSNGNMVGWAGETTLDVEYAHAGAPGANIVLVEASDQQLNRALQYAVQHRLGDVISLSWGEAEAQMSPGFARQYDSIFTQAASRHITIVASSGDQGVSNVDSNGNYYTHPVALWPATDPNVTAVGGTQLNIGASGTRAGPDAAWNDTYNRNAQNFFFGNDGPNPLATGGGKSALYGRPRYQSGVRGITGGRRGIPDISMSASCSVAVNTFETFTGGQGGWTAGCGTSESAPMFAAIVALADQMAGHPLGLINPTLYALAARHAPGIVPVASGNNTVTVGNGVVVHGYTVRNGYNLVTGLGTVNGQYLVQELAHGR